MRLRKLMVELLAATGILPIGANLSIIATDMVDAETGGEIDLHDKETIIEILRDGNQRIRSTV